MMARNKEIKWNGAAFYRYSRLGYWRRCEGYPLPESARWFSAIPGGWEDVSDPEYKQRVAEEAARRAGRD